MKLQTHISAARKRFSTDFEREEFPGERSLKPSSGDVSHPNGGRKSGSSHLAGNSLSHQSSKYQSQESGEPLGTEDSRKQNTEFQEAALVANIGTGEAGSACLWPCSDKPLSISNGAERYLRGTIGPVKIAQSGEGTSKHTTSKLFLHIQN